MLQHGNDEAHADKDRAPAADSRPCLTHQPSMGCAAPPLFPRDNTVRESRDEHHHTENAEKSHNRGDTDVGPVPGIPRIDACALNAQEDEYCHQHGATNLAEKAAEVVFTSTPKVR